jgi:hypothetical protein
MAKNTTSYAAEKRGDNQDYDDEGIMRTWEDVTPEEIGRWLGIVLYIDLNGARGPLEARRLESQAPHHPVEASDST